MGEIILKRSSRPNKKYMVEIDGKRVHFGQKGASDMTQHCDEKRKKRYLNRRSKQEKAVWNDIKKASFWARNLLWNKCTITDSIKDIEKKKNVKITKK